MIMMSEKRFLYRNFLEEEVEKRFTEEYDEEWGIYLSDNLTGDWYNINPYEIADTCNELWEQVVKLREENEQLQKRNKFLEEFDGRAKTVANLKEENEQLRKYNGQLKERLEKINGGYGHLTHRNGLTANEWLIESQERELKKKNEEISDWIERHSKDIAKICKQQATISQLEEENDNMNLFIKQTIEPLLFNCVFELNTIESMSQVELANKIEDEIIPFIQDLKYESPEEEKQDKSE